MASGPEMEVLTENEWLELVGDLRLSPRQAEIVKLLLSGMSDKQIAKQLHIGRPTVRTHLSRLFSKYEVQDRSELIVYVLGHFCERWRANGGPQW